MIKKNIFVFLIFANFIFGSEKLPEVKIESLNNAKIIKKEQLKIEKIEKKEETKKEIKKVTTYYPTRQSVRFTSGSC